MSLHIIFQISAGNTRTERERKKAKKSLSGSVTESYDSLILKVLNKLTVPDVSKTFTRPILKQKSKQSSEMSLNPRDESESQGKSKSIDSKSKSIESKSTNSRKSSGRSSARSVESMDGQTELLESLVHAAHAEDKLLREKQELRKELQKHKNINDELEAELHSAQKVVDELSSKYKSASKVRHDLEDKLKALKKQRGHRH
ncbi:hypothetical protein M758_10G118400 [Ceratodon purpureus]|nr:hypothetical protein M758_10G118400 [Ceratodon purpureus]